MEASPQSLWWRRSRDIWGSCFTKDFAIFVQEFDIKKCRCPADLFWHLARRFKKLNWKWKFFPENRFIIPFAALIALGILWNRKMDNEISGLYPRTTVADYRIAGFCQPGFPLIGRPVHAVQATPTGSMISLPSWTWTSTKKSGGKPASSSQRPLRVNWGKNLVRFPRFPGIT